jgi:hypothetical protein
MILSIVTSFATFVMIIFITRNQSQKPETSHKNQKPVTKNCAECSGTFAERLPNIRRTFAEHLPNSRRTFAEHLPPPMASRTRKKRDLNLLTI